MSPWRRSVVSAFEDRPRVWDVWTRAVSEAASHYWVAFCPSFFEVPLRPRALPIRHNTQVTGSRFLPGDGTRLRICI